MTKLDETPATVLGTLQRIRKAIVKPKNVFVQMSTSLQKLNKKYGANVTKVWKDFFDPLNSRERSLGTEKVEDITHLITENCAAILASSIDSILRSAIIAGQFLRMMTVFTDTSSPELTYSLNTSDSLTSV